MENFLSLSPACPPLRIETPRRTYVRGDLGTAKNLLPRMSCGRNDRPVGLRSTPCPPVTNTVCFIARLQTRNLLADPAQSRTPTRSGRSPRTSSLASPCRTNTFCICTSPRSFQNICEVAKHQRQLQFSHRLERLNHGGKKNSLFVQCCKFRFRSEIYFGDVLVLC